ncbi:MAG: taurine dioxygenase [Gammaproteobacteria bacterium]|jgi:taurine dioxygenase
MPLCTRALHADFGVEIRNVDLRSPSAELIGEIDALWVEHPVILIREQLLDEPQQIAFSKSLGEINIHVRTDIRSRAHPEVVLVSNLRLESGQNIGALASGEAHWHSDSCYKPRPDTGSILYALEVPQQGGKTSWANTQLAYEALSDDMRSKVDTLRGEFAYQIFAVDINADPDVEAIRQLTPDVVHPMVLTQPVSGRKGLYLDPLQTFGIDGMSPDESRPLLAKLVAHMTQPAFVFQHQWRRGDIVLWDNSRVLHQREPFDPQVPRLLKRTTVFLPPGRYPVPFSTKQI